MIVLNWVPEKCKECYFRETDLKIPPLTEDDEICFFFFFKNCVVVVVVVILRRGTTESAGRQKVSLNFSSSGFR